MSTFAYWVEDAPCLFKSEAIEYKLQSFRVRTIFEKRNDATIYIPIFTS